MQIDARAPIGGVLDAIRGALDPWLGEPQRKQSEGRVILVYRMTPRTCRPVADAAEGRDQLARALHGLRPRGAPVRGALAVVQRAAPRCRPTSSTSCSAPSSRALYQRKKGRDLFDLFTREPPADVDPERVVDCFRQYLDHEGTRISRAEIEMNLHEKLADPAFTSDIEPLIAPDVEWDLNEAAAYVQRELVPLLPGEPWKGDSA